MNESMQFLTVYLLSRMWASSRTNASTSLYLHSEVQIEIDANSKARKFCSVSRLSSSNNLMNFFQKLFWSSEIVWSTCRACLIIICSLFFALPNSLLVSKSPYICLSASHLHFMHHACYDTSCLQHHTKHSFYYLLPKKAKITNSTWGKCPTFPVT